MQKIAIGVGVIAIGVGVTVLTGGSATPALVAGVKAACTAGMISATINAAKITTKGIINGEKRNEIVSEAVKSAGDGFANGFMVGGVMAGASQVVSGAFKTAAKLGVETGRNAGLKIGELKLFSPNSVDNPNGGGTLLKIGDQFRIDCEFFRLLHMHLPQNENLHIPFGIIASGIIGGTIEE